MCENSRTASALDQLSDDDEDDECGVCFERPADTVLWPCMHRLCATCADGITRRTRQKGREQPAKATGAVLCPFCRQEVANHIPDEGAQTSAVEDRVQCRFAQPRCAKPSQFVTNTHQSQNSQRQTSQAEAHWVKEVIELRPSGRNDLVVRVDLSNQNLEDDDIIRLCPPVASHITDLVCNGVHSSGGFLGLEVYLQINSCSDLGVESVCRMLGTLLEAGIAYTRVLKLYRNRIGDRGAAALATLLVTHKRCAPGGELPSELHLSHNAITDIGADSLFAAARTCYPYRSLNGGLVPLWLRLEFNHLSGDLVPPRFCDVRRRRDHGPHPSRAVCAGMTACSVAHCTMHPVPPVHLPHIHLQQPQASSPARSDDRPRSRAAGVVQERRVRDGSAAGVNASLSDFLPPSQLPGLLQNQDLQPWDAQQTRAVQAGAVCAVCAGAHGGVRSWVEPCGHSLCAGCGDTLRRSMVFATSAACPGCGLHVASIEWYEGCSGSVRGWASRAARQDWRGGADAREAKEGGPSAVPGWEKGEGGAVDMGRPHVDERESAETGDDVQAVLQSLSLRWGPAWDQENRAVGPELGPAMKELQGFSGSDREEETMAQVVIGDSAGRQEESRSGFSRPLQSSDGSHLVPGGTQNLDNRGLFLGAGDCSKPLAAEDSEEAPALAAKGQDPDGWEEVPKKGKKSGRNKPDSASCAIPDLEPPPLSALLSRVGGRVKGVPVTELANRSVRDGGSNVMRVDLQQTGITDTDMQLLAPAVAAVVFQRCQGRGGPVALHISAEKNCLSDGGVRALVAALGSLMQGAVAYPRYISLFRNGIGDTGALALASLLVFQACLPGCGGKRVVQELHLSHNQLTAHGAGAIITAARNALYPYSLGVAKVPLWLRVEYNNIDRRLLPLTKHTHCPASGQCRAVHCARPAVPPVHLPHLEIQNFRSS